MDVIESGRLAPGNTVQNVSNLVRPALLIASWLPADERSVRRFRSSHIRIRAMARTEGTCSRLDDRCVAAGFGVGHAIGLPLIGTLVGTLVGAGLGAVVVARSAGEISAPHTF
jgi:hypothetical protein